MSQLRRMDFEFDRSDTTVQSHPSDVVAAHERALAGSDACSRYIEAIPGEKVHTIEIGEGAPLVMLQGSGPSALLFLPLLSRLTDVRAIAVDRPGFGLSDPHPWPPTTRREAAVNWIDSLLEALELEETALLGSSAGGTWSLWYTLAHPDKVDRLVLLGAPPTLSATRPPPPMLAIASFDPSNPPPDMPPPSRETVLQNMAVMREADTIVRYPEQIDALIAAGRDPVASRANIDELRTLISPHGWQQSIQTQVHELEGVAVPTLLIWGDHDPLGGAEAAHQVASAIPDSQLETFDAGHAPWLGHPNEVASLVRQFVI